jgi:septum formation protein
MAEPGPAHATGAFILASASPRRRRLLSSVGLCFDVVPAAVGEDPEPGETPARYVRRLAADKARAVARRQRALGDPRPVLGADTTVVLEGATLGKPAGRDEARAMLQQLSARAHLVITGLCLVRSDGAEIRQEVTTAVHFKELSAAEIEAYLDAARWSDKAGGYAIQDHAAFMVREIHGSYTNVVGLPLCEAVEALSAIGVTP